MSEIYKNLGLNNLEGEEWRDIPNYEGLYQVSNMGRVKSLKYGKEKILSQGKIKNGYLIVNLWKDGKMKTCYVHRLVGNAFIENPNGYRCFNHKNEIKTDNRAENLEPCDYQYNANFGTCIQRRVEKQSKQVYQYTKEKELIAIWSSVSEAGRNGFDKANVAACCRNCFNREGNNIYKGFIWSYTPL